MVHPNERSKQALLNIDGQRFSAQGVPLCPAGVEMCLQGRDAKKHTLTYVCPCKSKLTTSLSKCPLATDDNPNYLCQPHTQFGPTKKIHTDKDPRYWPQIARHTKLYQKLYNSRSSSERTNSTQKRQYKLEDAKHRSGELWLIRAGFIDICHHVDVWVKQSFGTFHPSLEQVLAFLGM